LSTKVEIKLAKADNTQWKQLEFDPKLQIIKTVVIPKGHNSVPPSIQFLLLVIHDSLLIARGSWCGYIVVAVLTFIVGWAADVGDTAKYPTSTKKPPKNWDRLEAEVKKEVCPMPITNNQYCWPHGISDSDVMCVYWLSKVVGFLDLDLFLARHLLGLLILFLHVILIFNAGFFFIVGEGWKTWRGCRS
jgi:hypothetical protein